MGKPSGIEMHPFPPEFPKGTPPPSGGPVDTKKKVEQISSRLKTSFSLEDLKQREEEIKNLKDSTLQSARANMPLKRLFDRISKALSETVFGWFFEKRATRPIDALLTTTIEKLFSTAITAGDSVEVKRLIIDTALVAQSSKDRALVGAVAGKNLKMVELLLTHGARQINDWYAFTLKRAVETGDLSIVKALLGSHPVRSHFKDALDSAIYSDQTDIAMALLNVGADPNVVHIYKYSPDPQRYESLLHHCVQKGDQKAVRSLVAHGARQITDSAGKTPLHYAIENGDEELVDILLAAEPKLNLEIEDVRSLLATAIEAKNISKDKKRSIALKLLAAGASPNTWGPYEVQGRSHEGSPLHYAIEAGDVELIKALVKNGASLVVESRRKGIPCPFELAIKNNKEEVLDELFVAITPQNVNMKFPKGETPLILAIRSGKTKYVLDLIKRGADLNMLSDENRYDLKVKSPLHEAVKNGNKEIVEILLKAGARPNLQNRGYRITPLGLAAEAGSHDIVNALLAHEADPNLENPNFGTALNLAVRGGHEEIVNVLLDKMKDPTTQKLKIGGYSSDRLLIDGICSKKPSILRALMDAGVKREYYVEWILPPFIWQQFSEGYYLETLRKNWNTEIADILLENGMNPNAKVPNYDTYFLEVAIDKDDPKIIKKLLKAGVGPNEARFYRPPLFTAIERSTPAVVVALLEGGANPNKLDRGNTPLHVAVKKGNIDIIKALLANGANPIFKNTDGKVPLDLVPEDSKWDEIRRLLTQEAGK